MVLNQLDRLKKDYAELEIYAKRLQKRGDIEKMKRIQQKKDFISQRIETSQLHYRSNIGVYNPHVLWYNYHVHGDF